MIDTIRFKIPVDKNFSKVIQNKSIEWTKYDHQEDELRYKFYKSEVTLGSYDRNINLFYSMNNEKYAFIEFSLPKYVYGHNVYLLYYPQIKTYLLEFYNNFCDYFPGAPAFEKWNIVRLDLCYAWKFQNDLVADNVLQILKGYDYSRKQKYIYDTSVMYKGRTYTIKWYLKHPEFYKHDYKNLLFKDTEYAHFIESVSHGVLRFEVTLRMDALKYIFEKKYVKITDVDNVFLHRQLNFYFRKFFKGAIPTFMTTQEIMNRLILEYGQTQGRILYLHYIMVNNKNEEEKQNYLRSLPKQTLYNYNSLLKKAKVGIKMSETLKLDKDFKIPSIYSVNSATVSRAEARETLL